MTMLKTESRDSEPVSNARPVAVLRRRSFRPSAVSPVPDGPRRPYRPATTSLRLSGVRQPL